MVLKAFALLFSCLMVYSASLHSQMLSEVALFKRCYGQLTGRPVPLGHALMQDVKIRKINALEACYSILDKTELNPSSGLLTAGDDIEAQWTLNNLNSFHRSWFSGNAVEQIQGYNDELGVGTRNIYDMNEPGLALTRAFFVKDGRYSDVLTLSSGVHGIRMDNGFVRRLIGWTVSFPGRSNYGNHLERDRNLFNFSALSGGFDGNSDTTNSLFADLPKIETGELKGIRLTTENMIIPNLSLHPLAVTKRGNEQPGLNFSFNLFQTQGGGILGSPSYVLSNFGHPLGLEMNGQTKLPRRWARSAMETFMCATLPALRESDVRQFLKVGSTARFRNSTSCLQCHANLDQMAYTARNTVLSGTDFSSLSAGSKGYSHVGYVAATYRAELPSVDGWPSEPVENFHRQTPSGKLYFRSFSGELKDIPVIGISGLGAAMATTDDFYQCASKRYFEFLTGITVALYDRKDPRYSELNKQLTSEAIADRSFVESLAVDLRKNQSPKQILKKIIASKYYRSANFRPAGDQ